MRKRLTAATLAALMALSMTACSGGKAAETTAAPETKVEETKAEGSKAEETKAETEAAKDGEKKPEDYTGSVVVYSPHDADPLNAGVKPVYGEVSEREGRSCSGRYWRVM